MAIGRGAGFVGAQSGSGIGKTLFAITCGVGGGAISQAQLDGIVNGLASGASLVNSNAQSESYTIVGIGDFTAASSTSVVILVEGGESPNTADDGEYFAAATVTLTATFKEQE